MARNHGPRFVTLVVVAAGLAVLFGGGNALAMFGMGMDFFGGFSPVPQPGNFINSHALIRAGKDSTAPTLRISNHPDLAVNRQRHSGYTGFNSHYSVDSRRSPAFEVDRRRSPGITQANNRQAGNRPPAPAIASAPAPASEPRVALPIASFFDSMRTLVWPSDAPVADGLDLKRADSDRASLVVLEKVERYRASPITITAEARLKLLAYGQPALQMIRGNATPRIAEGFHGFLLSLYDSLGDAANPQQ